MGSISSSKIKALIEQELPKIIVQDPFIRDFILRTVPDCYASK